MGLTSATSRTSKTDHFGESSFYTRTIVLPDFNKTSATWGGGVFTNPDDVRELEFGVAANRLLAWPKVDEKISQVINSSRPAQIIDFGCATGGFIFRSAQKYPEAKYLGLDSDSVAINSARSNIPTTATNRIRFEVTPLSIDLSTIQIQPNSITAISASLVMNYLNNSQLNNFFTWVGSSLINNGILVLVDLNPTYVMACLDNNVIYEGINLNQNPKLVRIRDLDNVMARLWSDTIYIELASANKLNFISTDLIQHSEEYLTLFSGKLPRNYPVDQSRYRIHVFKKAD